MNPWRQPSLHGLLVAAHRAGGTGFVVMSRKHLADIYAEIREEFKLRCSPEELPDIDFLTVDLPEGLNLFGLVVTIDETVEGPTIYNQTHLDTGVRLFMRQMGVVWKR